jgi:hypothetical protein
MTEVQMIRKEQSFYGPNREEAEAKAAPFVAATNGKIFFNGPVLAPPIGPNPKWQVDVEYFVEEEAEIAGIGSAGSLGRAANGG